MAIQTVQIGKQTFVCGLFWQSLSRPRELWKETRELAHKIDGDMAVVRKDQTVAQAGFAHTRDGARRGMLSLAAVVAEAVMAAGAVYDGQQQTVHNWLGAFKLPSGLWAYFAVRDANFLPNGDFAGTKQQVMDRLYGDYGLGGWNVVVGDPELEEGGFHNFLAKDLGRVLSLKKGGRLPSYRWAALRPVDPQIPWKPAAAVIAAVSLAAAGGFVYWKRQQAAQEEMALQPVVQSPDQSSPWTVLPAPETLVRACTEQLELLAPGGWTLEQYTCTPGQATYTWERNGSTVRFLLEQVASAKVVLSGDSASYSVPLKTAPTGEEALVSLEALQKTVVADLQLLGVGLRVTAPAPQTGIAVPNVAPPLWKAYPFTAELAGAVPLQVAGALKQPGVRINKLTYRAGVWSIEGVMYAQ